jgi:transposase
MKYVGVDLHKHSIVLCVVVKVDGCPKVVKRARFQCDEAEAIRTFFQGLGPFQVVVEATAAYEWFFLLIENIADRLVLAHPKKLRVIAESTRKSDKIDAEVLATFLAVDMIPEAYRPSPRVRQHRSLVRHRCCLQRRITSIKCMLRNVLGHYNADIAELFTQRGKQYLAKVPISAADRFIVQALWEQLEFFQRQLGEADGELERFAESGPLAEKEARVLLATIPQVGPVTIDVVLSELGDWRRFRSQKAVAAYAGINPGFRKSDGKCLELHITKDGSRLLRWAMIQAAWRLQGRSPRWKQMYTGLQANTGSKKKAIVGVARHLLCTMFAMLQSSRRYEMLGVPNKNQHLAPQEAAKTSAPARQKGAAPSRLLEGGRGSREPRFTNPPEKTFDVIRCGTQQRPRPQPLMAALTADHDRVNGGAALNSFVMVTAPCRRSRIDG